MFRPSMANGSRHVCTPPAVPNSIAAAGGDGEKTMAFIVVSQPVENFYKDEGGKANMLHLVVELRSVSPRRIELPALAELPIKLTLHYENGVRVEDEDEIFNVHSTQTTTYGTPRLELTFRIEKVSRRKDGQRFKVRVEVDEEKDAAMAAAVKGIFCSPICVLSKRKFPPSVNGHGGGTHKRPARRRAKTSRARFNDFESGIVDESKLLRRIQDAEEAIEGLLAKVQRQGARIAELEQHHSEVSVAGGALLLSGGLPSQSPPLGGPNEINSRVSTAAKVERKPDLGYYSPAPSGTDQYDSDAGLTYSGGFASPAHDTVGLVTKAGALKAPVFRRLRSADLTFNFGPPSPLIFNELPETLSAA